MEFRNETNIIDEFAWKGFDTGIFWSGLWKGNPRKTVLSFTLIRKDYTDQDGNFYTDYFNCSFIGYYYHQLRVSLLLQFIKIGLVVLIGKTKHTLSHLRLL